MLGWRILSYLLSLSSVGLVSLFVDSVDVVVVAADVGVNDGPAGYECFVDEGVSIVCNTMIEDVE